MTSPSDKAKARTASVYVDSLAVAVDRAFDYEIPCDMDVKPAMRVVVPFGKGNKLCQAFVVATSTEARPGLKKIHSLFDLEPCLPPYMVDAVEHLRREYFCTFREALGAVFPGGIGASVRERQTSRRVYAISTDCGAAPSPKNAPKMLAALAALRELGPMHEKELSLKSGAGPDALKRLVARGLATCREEPLPGPWDLPPLPQAKPALLADQAKALQQYRDGEGFHAQKYLLHGVTGSGKTFLFFEMMEDAIRSGRQCLLLVPEIALTPQMALLLERRFGQKPAMAHSKMPLPERQQAFAATSSGKAKVALGARSALFMPFQSLGLIVVDEEHEGSYKSSSSPRYDTVGMAEKISALTGARLVLSSATPSTEAYYRAKTGQYRLIELKERANGKPLPPVEVVDMRQELREGNRAPISRRLQEAIADRLKKGQQSLLFLNRRGYSTYVFCRKCGYTAKCGDCDVALTYHKGKRELLCHYCGSKAPPPSECPACGSDKIRFMGAGTEQIQSAVAELFPGAKTLRLDSDSALTRDGMQAILSSFAKGEADILIGTQMAVKGLDFHMVTLVGVILADVSLNFPDLNSPARTFQLVEQACGRAGRGESFGEALLQTYMPENRTLLYASEHDYAGFYAYDVAHRQEMRYPPFTEILGVFVANEDLDGCVKDAREMHSYAQEIGERVDWKGVVRIFAPAPASIQKLKGKHIYHLLVSLEPNSPFKGEFRAGYNERKAKIQSNVFVEINPATLL
ncbi:MAG: primosomal protein N' [Eubacteriaceae bacterium]|nr:primosomal protein N' [Eubacteriaceae bacterium]